ncbi:hypothetical protein [Neotabrizicola sp. VNH66]|uniref:hypothetical protein n=1 Tax=Neotabrizicola sp. VNH66 TaxID=3400918 RepID=UPI003C0F1D2D
MPDMPRDPKPPTDLETKRKTQKQAGQKLDISQVHAPHTAPARRERAVSDVEEPSLPEDDA